MHGYMWPINCTRTRTVTLVHIDKTKYQLNQSEHNIECRGDGTGMVVAMHDTAYRRVGAQMAPCTAVRVDARDLSLIHI